MPLPNEERCQSCHEKETRMLGALKLNISSNMQQITEVVAQTSRGAHESASAANRLSALADDLRRIVGQFKVS